MNELTAVDIKKIKEEIEYKTRVVRPKCVEDPMCVSRIQPCIRISEERAALLLLNASLDESYPVQALVRGGMTKAVLVHSDGSETELACAREGDRLCIQVPSIGAWEIATIFVSV